MLIKIVQNGIESDWFQLTKKAHRELIKKKPEAAVIHIEDIYPESPDTGRVIQLDFRLFTVLTREFKLEDLKQEKRDERHVEKLRLEARPANAPELASKTLDEQYIRFYNELRPHRTLKYKPPQAFEEAYWERL